MRSSYRVLAPLGLLLAAALALTACQTFPRLAPYDAQAHQTTAALKVETLNLMSKSSERFTRHRAEVVDLTLKIQTAYEVARSTPNNDLVAQQWAIMQDPERDLYGGFVKRWQDRGTVNAAFREEMVAQVAEGYDYILCLEAAKRTPVPCKTGATP